MSNNPASKPTQANIVTDLRTKDQFLIAVTNCSTMADTPRRIAMRLGLAFNVKSGRCDPGYEFLRREIQIVSQSGEIRSISRSALFRWLNVLERDGWLLRKRKGRNNAEYTLFVHPQRPMQEMGPQDDASDVPSLERDLENLQNAPGEPAPKVPSNGSQGPNTDAGHKRTEGTEVERGLTAARTSDASRESNVTENGNIALVGTVADILHTRPYSILRASIDDARADGLSEEYILERARAVSSWPQPDAAFLSTLRNPIATNYHAAGVTLGSSW